MENTNDINGTEAETLTFLEMLGHRLGQFKQRLAEQSGALASFDATYCSGGRTLFRDAVNSFFLVTGSNLRALGGLSSKMITDVVLSKYFPKVGDGFTVYVKDIVSDLRKNPEQVRLVKQVVGEVCAAIKDARDLFEKEEFPGTVSLYGANGKLCSPQEVQSEFNELNVKFNTYRCSNVRSKITKLLAANRQKYNEAATELLRKGLPIASVFDELQRVKALPLSIDTEESLKDKLGKDDYPVLCDLYNRLKQNSAN